MKRNTKLDNAKSKVYGTKRIYDSSGAVERAETIGDADSALDAAQEAATNAVAVAVQAAERAQEARKEAEEQLEQEKAAELAEIELDKKKKVAQSKAALAVQAAVNEVVGGDPVVTAEAEVPAEQAEDKVEAVVEDVAGDSKSPAKKVVKGK